MKLPYGILIATMAFLMIAGTNCQAEEEMYRIKPGDQLNLYVHENNDLTMGVTVLPDGTISYPLVGNLYVQGLTVSGLQDILTQKLSAYLQKPVVVISLGAETVDRVYILGEVRSPNTYQYHEGDRLTDYLAQAGGPTDMANWKKCSVYTINPGGQKRTVNLRETFQSRDLTLNPVLKPNDTVFIERKSGFIINNWGEIGQIFGIMVGVATLYFISSRR
jgi:polysaccharide export outer membrane protein